MNRLENKFGKMIFYVIKMYLIKAYWEIHWDYKKNRPENFKQYIGVKKAEAIQKAKNKSDAPSMLSSICSCLKKTITLNPIAGNR